MHVAEHERDPLSGGERRERDSKRLASRDRIGRIGRLSRLGFFERNLCPRAAPAGLRGAEGHPRRHGSYPRVEPSWFAKPPETTQSLDCDVLGHIAGFVTIAEHRYGERQRDAADAAHENLGGSRIARQRRFDLHGDRCLFHAYLVRS